MLKSYLEFLCFMNSVIRITHTHEVSEGGFLSPSGTWKVWVPSASFSPAKGKQT